ncbi:aminotransferase class I/II-fold pyridoxal phosphate-dependent enzyme [Alicyclobacillus sendaiensis]|uniref:Aminotransferase n=1 Tax=Alicyclobacillus sendaiensis PA2 TaxID=3029425 RepID=A0ABT6XWY8_ALISE|nr:aminotransferase class I/II-fold pyridoxal phosphate-dependent enzyme [Alicyclobacillus sendaiensis]MDI9259615.1 aminotransferase class I/II-fold pyridoxal phosphate-dependent enzyme [Alicyclobacillus sendaiensis PA2]
MQDMSGYTRGLSFASMRRFADLVADEPDAIILTIGQPHFPTPAHIAEAAKRAIDEGFTSYTPNRGIRPLREAASAYYERFTGHRYDPDREVLVTVGTTHAIDIATRAILAPGDEVIIPAPAYPGYEGAVRLAGGHPVFVDTRATGFLLTPDALRQAITPRTKLLILASPANPTGAVYREDELHALARMCVERDLYVLSDEIYAELQFDGSPVSISSVPGMRERTVVLHGLSKSHAMTGWRIGFAFAPEPIAAEMAKAAQFSVSCPSSISQMAALEALTTGHGDSQPMREAYRANRDLAVEALQSMGVPVVKPAGAFYVFPELPKALGMTSDAFCEALARKAHVALVSGSCFTRYGEGYVRVSLACPENALQEALERMARFVARRRQG